MPEVSRKELLANLSLLAGTPDGLKSLRQVIVDFYTGSLVHSPSQRNIQSLGSLVQVLNGDRSSNYPSKEHRVPVGIPFINAGHLVNGLVSMENMDYITTERFNLLRGGKIKTGDVLFCLRGSLGKCAVFNGTASGAIASSLAILRPSDDILSTYLLKFLQSTSCKRQIRQYDNGSAQPNLAGKSILKFEIPLPPVAEQRRIVAMVDELIALVDQLEEAQAKRDSIRTAVRKSTIDAVATASTSQELDKAWKRISSKWDVVADTPESVEDLRRMFLDLAVAGKLSTASDKSGSIITWDTKELKLDTSKIWQVQSMSEQPPEGWSRVPLARIGTWGSGGTPTASRSDFYTNGNIPWAVIGDLNDGLVLDTARRINQLALESSSAKIIPAGTVLIAMYGASIGKTGITGVECCTNQAIAHCVVDRSLISSEYFFLVAKSLKPYLNKAGKGAAQPNISQTVLKHLLIDLPDLETQSAIIDKVTSFVALCDQLEEQLESRNAIAKKFARSVTASDSL